MIWKASITLVLTLCVLSEGRYATSEQKVTLRYPAHHGELKQTDHQKPENHGAYAKAYPSYEFSYKVDDPHTHDNKAQHEERDGSKVTGNYWLIQPDGEKRYIKYHVDDKSGFIAVINYTSPHSSVYYARRKQHEEDGNTEIGKEEDKNKESLQDARQEVEEEKSDVENEGNKNQGKEGENEKLNDDKENANRPQNDDGQEGREEQQEGSQEGNQEGGRSDVQEDSQRGDQGGELQDGPDSEQNRGDENGGDIRLEEIPDGGRDSGQDSSRNDPTGEQRSSPQVGVQDNEQGNNDNRGDNQENKQEGPNEEKQSVHSLWAKFPSFTIIHDYPKLHQIPVWEKNEDPEYYVWPGFNSWKNNHYGGKRQNSEENRGIDEIKGGVEVRGEIEKNAGEESGSPNAEKNNVDIISNDETKGDEEKLRVENRQLRVEKTVSEVRRVINHRRGREQRRNGEERQSSIQRRGGEERRGGQERRGGNERREYRHRRGGISRGTENRNGDPSHTVKFTPIPYGQRY